MDVYEKAQLLISATQNELLLGTKHYRASTMQPLTSTREILKALSEQDLIIEPKAERQHLFEQAQKG